VTPSIWPAVLSAGLALAAFGVPTSPWFCLAGVLLLVVALVGWIGEVRRGGEHGAH
jgi:Cytochrome c oxidase subunit IV